MLELGKISWSMDFHQMQYLLQTDDKVKKWDKPKAQTKSKDQAWFCKDFNHGTCAKTAPHTAIINGQDRQVQHICAKCYLKKQIKVDHSEESDACPLKQK